MNEKLLLIVALMLTISIIYKKIIDILDTLAKIHKKIIQKEIEELKNIHSLRSNYIADITKLLLHQSKLNYLKIIKNEKLIKHNFLIHEEYLNNKIEKKLFMSKIIRKKSLISAEKKLSLYFYNRILTEIKLEIMMDYKKKCNNLDYINKGLSY